MVKKTILDNKFVNDILSFYNIESYESFTLIKKGNLHSNYILITKKGKFVLRVFEEREENQIMLEMKLLEKLKNIDIPIPRVIKTHKNDYLIKLNGKYIAIFTFLNGTHIENNSSLKQVAEIGKYMGRFHKSLHKFKPLEIKYKNYNYNKAWVNKILEDVKKDNPNLPIKYETYILEILNSIIEVKKLPQGLNHGDLHEDNALFEGEKLSGFLDFDDCFYGNLLSDVGCGITFWCVDKQIDFQKCKSFLNAYEKERKLEENEKDYLYHQSLLFMLIHLIYWWWEEKNWDKDIKPLRVLNALKKTNKEEFNKKLFS